MVNQWSVEKANEWYGSIRPIRGCNYLPRTAVNSTEMWQASTFDPQTITEELGWAKNAGYNSVRVFVQFLVWQDDPDGLKSRMDQFLDIAHRHAISAMFILFDDCAFAGKEPYLGQQDDPVPGIHNSGWTPSPGLKRVTDKTAWPALEAYAKDIVGTFANDERVLIWDLYNEPGNSNMGDKSLPLVEASFAWSRETNAQQPLTISLWRNHDEYMAKCILELSDITSFHHYEPTGIEAVIELCQAHGRPVVCTEWLHRPRGQTFEGTLPIFSQEKVGWYNWGLVAGRTQTYLDWRKEQNVGEIEVWQHDIFHADGEPYSPGEIEQIQSFAFD